MVLWSNYNLYLRTLLMWTNVNFNVYDSEFKIVFLCEQI